ncbi:hypothetical protein [Geobacillus thermodenitrificans]|uniref:Uncharacterized protein n=1 Tax=Geobacillus thermodenitrificans TaxID=33940 RepID=A0ABY9Q8S4_GEOTD|nr:hypothetical protein [Geobacillus thermodenitrificans]ARA98612.1 hypothetical protein GD3902_11560 [Geobacillus thermodenitrificans]ARA99124.1 hypothetical protein GD3902_14445 [Geobacillus thermodenitrificans]MCG5026810.1 hypothetical protein [Anoxybacillus flavithermus]WMV75310.1 hypothetical protein HSX42_13685 [Geobacillus thermodenitrificans]
MTKYVVIKDFRDLQDNLHLYRAGDKYPRKGRVKKERIEELMSDKNLAGEPLIAQVEEGDE